MGKFTTVFWDLDQTLLNFDRSMEYAFGAVCGQYGISVADGMMERYAEINSGFWKRLELGEFTQEEVAVGRFRVLFREWRIDQVKPEAFNQAYQKALGSVYFYMEGAKELVTALRRKGYRQYIVTNGVNSTQESKVRRSGLDKLMDGVFVSELLGYPKPMKEFFDACFASLPDVGRKECILVGDSLTSDMRGAQNAGIASCWFNPKRREKDVDVRTDYEILRLEELLPILEQE